MFANVTPICPLEKMQSRSTCSTNSFSRSHWCWKSSWVTSVPFVPSKERKATSKNVSLSISLFVYDEFELHVRSLVSPTIIYCQGFWFHFVHFKFFHPPFSFFYHIFLWNNHPEAQGLVRERVGHWTILRALATPVPNSKSNPIQFSSILTLELVTSFLISYNSTFRNIPCSQFALALLPFCPYFT